MWTSLLPATGTTPSHTANTMISMTPSQNVGMEIPTSPPSMLRWSTRVRDRTADTVPTAIPRGTAISMEARASSRVAGKRFRISYVTRDPVR